MMKAMSLARMTLSNYTLFESNTSCSISIRIF